MNESTIIQSRQLDRREFLKATGGFLLAVTLDGGDQPGAARTRGPDERHRLHSHRRG